MTIAKPLPLPYIPIGPEITRQINMRELILACLMACALALGCTPASAQQPAPIPVEKPEPPKPAEPKRVEREGSTAAVSYMLAGIGTLIVMVVICMPARRD